MNFSSLRCCCAALSSRISLTHCVVSRSTSVIIITSALYLIWHAVSSSPLDTFLFVVAHLFLIHAHFISNWNGCVSAISTTICRLLLLNEQKKRILFSNQRKKKRMNKKYVKHFFCTNYPCYLKYVSFCRTDFQLLSNVIWFLGAEYCNSVCFHLATVKHWDWNERWLNLTRFSLIHIFVSKSIDWAFDSCVKYQTSQLRRSLFKSFP